MSNIYGVISVDKKVKHLASKHLTYWNRIRSGMASADKVDMDDRGMLGCFRDHLNNAIPAAEPVIQDDNYIAVIDAVLYNREELLSQLKLPLDIKISDEYLLLQYYTAFGGQSLKQINGDFAGVIVSKKENRWILFRDHIGVRPLYYYIDDYTVLFSTDIRGIASISGIDTGINEGLFYKLGMGYPYPTRCETEFKNVKCVSPASCMEISFSDVSMVGCDGNTLISDISEYTYWELGANPVKLSSEKAYQEQLFELVEDSVKRRVNAVDGLIGCELSGGLDSGVVAAMLGRTGREIKCYSWSWSPDIVPYLEGSDERKVIEEFCAYTGLNCQFKTKEIADNHMAFLESIDQRWPPAINTGPILEGSLYMKSQGAKVMFTGHGGDEGVSHRAHAYELFYYHEYIPYMKCIWNDTKGKKLRFLRFLKGITIRPMQDSKIQIPANAKNNASEYLSRTFIMQMKEHVKLNPPFFRFDPKRYVLNGGSRPRLDNVAFQGNAAGIRYMVPFLDYRVIDFAVSIPRFLYYDGITNRKIYRNAFASLLSPSLRKVSYKQTPSHDVHVPTKEERYQMKADYRVRILELVHKLDKEMWQPYLDFNALEKIDFSDDFDGDEYEKAGQAYFLLAICVLTQDILKCEIE